MLRRTTLGAVIAVVVALAVALGGTTGAYAGHGKDRGHHAGAEARALAELGRLLGFYDLDEAPWAVKHIVKLHAKGLLKGRGHGRMAPNASVSRIEVIVLAVRAMGLEDEARELAREGVTLDFEFADARTLSRYAWALPYLQLAVERGLIANGGLLQPDKPATRLWVSEILVKALLEAGVITKADLTAAGRRVPDFKDASQIPPEKYAYVALAVGKGLIRGYPNGKFMANKPVTRAELAAMIDRLEDTVDWFDPRPPRNAPIEGTYARGWLKEAGSSSLVVLVKEDGRVRERRLDLARGVLVFLDNRQATVADLRPGDRVEVFLNGEGDVAYVFATFTPIVLTGRVQAVSSGTVAVRLTRVDANRGDNPVPPPASYVVGQSLRFGVSGATVVAGGSRYAWGDAYARGLVRNGDTVELRLHHDTVYELAVKERQASAFTGIVTERAAVSGGLQLKIRVTDNDDANPVPVDAAGVTTVVIPASAAVYLDARRVDADAVRVGDRVEVRMESGVVTQVRIDGAFRETGTARARIESIVRAGSHAALGIEVLGDVAGSLPGGATVGTELIVVVTPEVAITVGGEAASIDDLAVGEEGRFSFRHDALVRIEIDRD